jgi:hypothetical protein
MLLPVTARGPQRHAVEGVGERDHDAVPARHLAGELQRCLHGVRARRARELHLEAKAAGRQHQILDPLQERPLRGGGHVEPVDDPLAAEVADEGFDQGRVVVPVVQGSRTGEEVQVAATVLVDELASLAAGEDGGP